VNTSDIASKQTNVQDTVGSAERHHSVFEWPRIKAPLAVLGLPQSPTVTELRQ
jgi:hypothetical protein